MAAEQVAHDPTQHYQPPPKVTPQPQYMDNSMASRFKPKAPRRELCTCITIFVLAGFTVLVLWLVLRPYKPQFTVVGVAVYVLNASSPPLISTTMQFNIIIRNPNKRVSVNCDPLSAFVSYRNQPITPQVMLPPLYLEKHSTVSLSPVIGGASVPLPVEVSNGLVLDEAYGVVGLKLVFQGRLRWKIGAIRTAHYGVFVKCNVAIGLKEGFSGQVPLLGAPPCDVDI